MATSLLFFGCRTSEGDYLYEDELSRYEADGVVKVDAVFSREGDPQRRYVQDAIIQRSDDVWDLIANKRANIYVHGARGPHRTHPGIPDEFWRLDGRQQLARRLAS